MPNNSPVDGIVTKGLNENKEEHNGIDIAAKKNSPVFPAQEGMVIFSNILNNYGNTIIISHPNNYYTVYSHLDKSIVIERDYILTNQVIGYVGQTGNSNGPHLHFEIWKNNHILDPRDFIKEYKLKDVSIEEYK
jgi:murein DD-endopeptidase MepM/ murein hydrolase activator NlpD